MNDELTLSPAQQAVLAKLERRGFTVSRISRFEGEAAPTVFLSKRVRHGLRLAELGPDATVNGRADVDAEISSLLS